MKRTTAWAKIPALGLLVAGALLAPGSALPQGPGIIDQGVLTVRDSTGIIGREEFTVSTTGTGISIATVTLYPPRRTRVTLRSTINLSPDSTPTSATFTASDGRDRSVLAQFTRRRLTIRVNAPQGESVAEYPRPPRALVVDDSIFALYAILPGSHPGSLRIVSPRTGDRIEAELEVRGREATIVGGERRQLTHIILRLGTRTRHIWYDDAGRLTKVELENGIVAERTPAGRQG